MSLHDLEDRQTLSLQYVPVISKTDAAQQHGTLFLARMTPSAWLILGLDLLSILASKDNCLKP